MRRASVFPIAVMVGSVVAFLVVGYFALPWKVFHRCPLIGMQCQPGTVRYDHHQCFKSCTPILQNTLNANATPANSTNTGTSPTADWKTYTNTVYGYSIQYPATWSVSGALAPKTIQINTPDANKKTSLELSPAVYIVADQTYKEHYLANGLDTNDSSSDFYSNWRTTTIHGVTVKRQFEGGIGESDVAYFPTASGKYIAISWDVSFAKDYPEYEQILASFAFTSTMDNSTRVIFSNSTTNAPIALTSVSLYSDNGVRCVTEPCPTNGRNWSGTTDANGAVTVPASMVDESMTFTLDGYNAKELHSGVQQADQSWKLTLTRK